MAGNWTNGVNDDGLKVRFNLNQAEEADRGTTAVGVRRAVKVDITDATALATSDTSVPTGDEVSIPAGAYIVNAYYIVKTAHTSGGSATLTFGLKNSAGSAIDADGIDAAIAVAALGANAAVNCDGAYVGGALKLASEAWITAIYATAAFTAGAGTLVVEYILDV